ncbi:hypothetical protein IC762_12105 [Bradyrhizobium genosp. L]|uniref:hypothetical protein n=1 Tax=Bradyrhizobium genosp. L TaxID=83637 RepID=UPI0018A25957|nr:hypothetical protein [Bradyrhizobium genosp. L]QPF86987.1 hypothetical protein IC762_12105 [Bradyrhizobium genosp. L]
MSKTDLWDRLGRTDPKHTKPFNRSGGFKGTSIKPIYSYRKMTEEFGPCGTGWGINEPTFQVVPGHEGEQLVYCTVSIWHGVKDAIVFGVGGDKAVIKQSSGLRGDDEAFKKAFTDAVTNALKMIGVGADVHMGMFDDDKYVNALKDEFSETEKPPVAEKPPVVDLMTKNAFMVDCRETIAKYTDADALAAWWQSEDQKVARRNHQLDQSQVDGLKAAVIERRAALSKKAA